MRKIKIQEHKIASASEMRELERVGAIEVYVPKNPRHKFFHDIKIAPYQAYKGKWGNEHLKWDGEGWAYVRATDTRFEEIQKHIIKDLYEDND